MGIIRPFDRSTPDAGVDVRCDRVSKAYFVRSARPVPAAGPRPRWPRPWERRERVWAVRDVSFEVARGEALGVIGPNGAGKTTLLRLLSGITAPTAGEIVIRGTIGALLEIGSGFHPELTGRENLFLSGAILGLRRKQVAARLDEIVEFAGVGRFLDLPVKYYSSGMYVRLGFALAAHLDPHILLIDEVLAVGDLAFQARCFQRIQELRHHGTTIIFISHDLSAVERLCDRALLMQAGRIAAVDTPAALVARYRALTAAEGTVAVGAAGAESVLRIEALTLHDLKGTGLVSAHTRAPLVARLAYSSTLSQQDLVGDLFFYGHEDGALLAQCSTSDGGLDLPPGSGAIEFRIPDLLLQPGVYVLGATLRRRNEDHPAAWYFARTTLYVDGERQVAGPICLPHDWRHVPSGPEARARQVTASEGVSCR